MRFRGRDPPAIRRRRLLSVVSISLPPSRCCSWWAASSLTVRLGKEEVARGVVVHLSFLFFSCSTVESEITGYLAVFTSYRRKTPQSPRLNLSPSPASHRDPTGRSIDFLGYNRSYFVTSPSVFCRSTVPSVAGRLFLFLLFTLLFVSSLLDCSSCNLFSSSSRR